MTPLINGTSFGNITIDSVNYDFDVIINSDGMIRKRKKKLSKKVYGTSHILSLPEAEYIFEEGTDKLIIGSGQNGVLELSKEASEFFNRKNCKIEILPTPKAVECWNKSEGNVVSVFHITC